MTHLNASTVRNTTYITNKLVYSDEEVIAQMDQNVALQRQVVH